MGHHSKGYITGELNGKSLTALHHTGIESDITHNVISIESIKAAL